MFVHPALRRITLTVVIGGALLLGLFACLAPGTGAHAPVPQDQLAGSDPKQAVLQGPEANAVDLSVNYISRIPHYRRYCLDYSNNVPELCSGTEGEKRFPDPGEFVTFTAHVVNQGAIVVAGRSYTWSLDGVDQESSELASLAAGESADVSWSWPWQTGAHTVTLQVAADQGEPKANNRLDSRTDAHYLEILVHPYFVDAFAQVQNFTGTYSFADWLQAQVVQMNQRLAAAAFAATPGGIPDRVRIDVITPTVDVGGDTVLGQLAYDGRWTFRTERNYKDTPVDEARQSALNYAQAFAHGIDWGLIHELTHQLGIIDLYQLNVSPSAGNEVEDQDGLPLLAGHLWPYPDLMGGDDVRPYDGTHYSPHTARGLVSNSAYRRGYFGEYLYDLPDEVWVRALDNQGQPAAVVTVTAYQSKRNVVGSTPVFTGVTSAGGDFRLPDRPVSPGVTTATGHTLRPNPFGAIDVVGRNGQLLLRLNKGDQETYAWLTITDLNKAAWSGETAVTVTIPGPFPNSEVTPPAPRLQVRTSGNSAHLTWQPVAGAETYNLYQGVWPDYYPLRPLASGLSATQYSSLLSSAARFAVTAVGPGGTESGFSNVARAELLYAPRGLVWLSGDEATSSALESPGNHFTSGQVLIADAHPGALLQLLPPQDGEPGAWVGRVGSEHIGLVGASVAAPGPGEVMGVALPGGQRVWVLDASQKPLNWFGRVDNGPSPLDLPSGLALAGPPFTVDLALTRPDPHASLLLPFDGDLADPDGTAPTQAEGLSFAPGRHGQAVIMGGAAALQYPATGFDARRGGIEFWLRPDWPGVDPDPHVLFEAGDPSCLPELEPLAAPSPRPVMLGSEATKHGAAGEARPFAVPDSPSVMLGSEATKHVAEDEARPFAALRVTEPCYRLRIAQEGGGLYVWATDFDDLDKAAWADVAGWQAGEWHHVAATWEDQRLNLYLDGRLAWAEALRMPISGTVTTLAIGGTLDGEGVAEAAFDSLRISTYPRLGNSDLTRVLVSELTQRRVNFFDLLGNAISTFPTQGGPPDALTAPGPLAVAADGSVWLLDTGARLLQQFSFNGWELIPLSTLPLSGITASEPRALAADATGHLALAAGDRVYLLDPDQAQPVLAFWGEPNDGSPGPFRQPMALAFGPDGDLAVGEAGNMRVSFILREEAMHQVFSPAVLYDH